MNSAPTHEECVDEQKIRNYFTFADSIKLLGVNYWRIRVLAPASFAMSALVFDTIRDVTHWLENEESN